MHMKIRLNSCHFSKLPTKKRQLLAVVVKIQKNCKSSEVNANIITINDIATLPQHKEQRCLAATIQRLIECQILFSFFLALFS